MWIKMLLLLFLLPACGAGDRSQISSIEGAIKTDQIFVGWEYYPPTAWRVFCEKYDQAVLYKHKTFTDFEVVYYEIDNNFIYSQDAPGDDAWDLMIKSKEGYYNGDCDDFALTLRDELIKSGFLKSAVRVALCCLHNVQTSEYDKQHMVTIVTFSTGETIVAGGGVIELYEDYDAVFYSILDESGLYWNRVD